MSNESSKKIDWIELKELIQLDFGVRITLKDNAGTKYPVYGGGGESFRTDSYNRENEYVIARFAMSAKCVRYVEGKFYLLDSGGTFSIKEHAGVSKAYMGYVLTAMQDQIYAQARGQAQKNLDVDAFYKIKVPRFSAPVQQRIVKKLDKKLAAIEKARQAAIHQLADINLLSNAIIKDALKP